jgi:cellulose synthase operon protein C
LKLHSHRLARFCSIALWALLLSVGAGAPEAPRPFDVHARELATQVHAAGRSARGMIPLLELWRGYGEISPRVSQALLGELAEDRSLAAATRNYAAQLAARARLRNGDLAGSRQRFAELGFITDWRVVGPFDNEGKTGFDRVFEPEAQRMGPIEPGATYPGRERAVTWRRYPDVSQFGYVSFDAVFRPDTNVCAYAESFVTSPRAQALTLWVGGGGAVRAWWNGEKVIEDGTYRQPNPDRSVHTVSARTGVNRLLVKACTTQSTWGFYARLADANGEPTNGWSAAAEGEVEGVQPGARAPRSTLEAPLAQLERAAGGARPGAQALEDLARFLTYTGSDDPSEQRAKQLMERALASEPNSQRLLFSAQLATTRGEMQTLFDSGVLLARARLASTGPNPRDALPLLDRIPQGTSTWALAQLVRADVLDDLDLEESARAALQSASSVAPESSRILSLRTSAALATERHDEAMQLQAQMLELRWDDLSARRALIGDAMARGDRAAAIAHMDIFRQLAVDRTGELLAMAEFYDALGDEAESMGSYRAAIDLAPDDAGARAAFGRALLRAGQADAASEMLRAALVLRPQDADTRELLERIRPEARPDEAVAASEAELLSRVREDVGYPTRILQSLTVNTVFPSGLGSSFHQTAVQIQDAEGARSMRTFPIQFDPDVQRVTVRAARVYRAGRRLQAMQTFEQQLGEPWYRIWYDTRALVIVFPDLEPGDVVEVRWRIDDIAERNQFHDYYGDLHHLAARTPTAHIEYVLITPASRAFYFNEPRLPGLTHEERVVGETRTDRFVANEVPAVETEDNMPGYTEVAPYLHVSTYRTWEDVGRWYWGLVHDQLYADEHLRGVVRGLMAQGGDTRAKVERIYDWVIRNTRYVGLEFGIHGFLPYRVPQIVERGFGDCKDKASLIFTMLREAGIEARMVLTRTRRNGDIDELPASLAVFDHAIAYVPELDLYLDGTAENTGTREFPQMDQGVMVLHVWAGGAELHRTPVTAASENRRERVLRVELETDGRAHIVGDDVVRGVEAPGNRATFQAEGTRRERLERALGSVFTGLSLREQRMEGLDQNGAPVRIHFAGEVPQLAVVDADGLRTRATVLDSLTRAFARGETRSYPLDLGGSSSYREERHIRIPAGMRALSIPEGGVVESPYGRLSLEVRREGDQEVVATTELTLPRDRMAATEYQAFRQWTERADVLLRQRVVLGGGR